MADSKRTGLGEDGAKATYDRLTNDRKTRHQCEPCEPECRASRQSDRWR